MRYRDREGLARSPIEILSRKRPYTMDECGKEAELQEKAAELKRSNYTFGTVIDEKPYVVNIDETGHIIIYGEAQRVVGNGQWDPENRVIIDAQGIFEDEDWDLIDQAVCDSEFGNLNAQPSG